MEADTLLNFIFSPWMFFSPWALFWSGLFIIFPVDHVYISLLHYIPVDDVFVCLLLCCIIFHVDVVFVRFVVVVLSACCIFFPVDVVFVRLLHYIP